ncbi:phosphatidylglycerophosphatase A [Desulfohalobiaceae bacterium Ax17]|nr:phosphatidylglycerophosphatase A [Desulfovulcanus ferrireducens]
MNSMWIKLATLGPIGHLPKAPGTWGSLAATLLAPFTFIPLSFPLKILVLVIIFFLGAYSASLAEKSYNYKDPGCVIIDELLGQWVTFLTLTQRTWFTLLVGFFLFRAFDILKPFPIRKSEQWLKNGFGIMIDDLLAGIYAGLCLFIIIRIT